MNFHHFGPLKMLNAAPFPTWNVLDWGHVSWGWWDLCRALLVGRSAALGVNSLEITQCDCPICACHPSGGKNPCLWAADYPRAHYNIVPKQIPQASACNHFYLRVGKYPPVCACRWGRSRSHVRHGRRDGPQPLGQWLETSSTDHWSNFSQNQVGIGFDFSEKQQT